VRLKQDVGARRKCGHGRFRGKLFAPPRRAEPPRGPTGDERWQTNEQARRRAAQRENTVRFRAGGIGSEGKRIIAAQVARGKRTARSQPARGRTRRGARDAVRRVGVIQRLLMRSCGSAGWPETRRQGKGGGRGKGAVETGGLTRDDGEREDRRPGEEFAGRSSVRRRGPPRPRRTRGATSASNTARAARDAELARERARPNAISGTPTDDALFRGRQARKRARWNTRRGREGQPSLERMQNRREHAEGPPGGTSAITEHADTSFRWKHGENHEEDPPG